MSIHWDTLREAILETQKLDEQIAANAEIMANLISRHLPKVSTYRLKILKRKLQRFDSRTGKWRR